MARERESPRRSSPGPLLKEGKAGPGHTPLASLCLLAPLSLGERAGPSLSPLLMEGKPWWTVPLDIRLCGYNESFGMISESERRWRWCRGADSNRRHMDFQSIALPAELPRQGV